jgi:hypothetical protein
MRRASVADSLPFVGPFGDVLSGLLDRSPGGASLRLALLSVVLAVYWFALAWAAGFPVLLPRQWTDGLPFPLNPIVDLAASFLAPAVLVHLLPVAAGIWLGLRMASHYVADLFELEDFATATRYLAASVFGLGEEGLEIDRGELETYDSAHPLVRIGGPGRVRVHLGFAAVTETAGGELKIYGPRAGIALSGFERLRAVIDLRDQLRELPEVRAVSRDGVEIVARRAQMVFRVYSGGRPRGLEDPYPFTEESIRRLVYGRPVSEGGPLKWTDTLPSLVEREIQAFVSALTLEKFLSLQLDPIPGEDTPSPAEGGIHISSQRLVDTIHTDATRQRLREEGLELTWVSVGSWEIPDPTSAPGTGVSQSLILSWRDVERARRLQVPEVLAQRRTQAGREYEAQVLREMLEAWHGPLRGHTTGRTWAALRAVRQRLPPASDAAPQSGSEPHTGYSEVLAHLDRLTQPDTAGGRGSD